MEYTVHLPPAAILDQKIYRDNVEYYPYTNHPVKDIVAHYMAREQRYFVNKQERVDTDE